MRRDVEADMRWSKDTFDLLLREFEGTFLEAFEAVSFREVEDPNSAIGDLENMLDVTAGWDRLIVTRTGVKGVAVRIQDVRGGDAPYNTFTVRCSRPSGVRTEWQKRIEGIVKEDVYPQLTMQGYVGDGFFSFAIVRTIALFRTLAKRQRADSLQTKSPREGDASFVFIAFEDLCKDGVTLRGCWRLSGQNGRLFFSTCRITAPERRDGRKIACVPEIKINRVRRDLD